MEQIPGRRAERRGTVLTLHYYNLNTLLSNRLVISFLIFSCVGFDF